MAFITSYTIYTISKTLKLTRVKLFVINFGTEGMDTDTDLWLVEQIQVLPTFYIYLPTYCNSVLFVPKL